MKEEYRVATLALLFALWGACWMFGRVPVAAGGGRRFRALLWGGTVAALVGWLSFHWLVPGEEWEPYTPNTLARLREQGVTVLVDFTSDSCLVCKTNKVVALNTRTTRQYMRQHGITGLTADFSEESPDIEQLMRDLGRIGNALPFYAVFPGDGRPPITFDGLLTQGSLLDKLKQAGPSVAVSVSRTAASRAATN